MPVQPMVGSWGIDAQAQKKWCPGTWYPGCSYTGRKRSVLHVPPGGHTTFALLGIPSSSSSATMT
eukprot:3826747-Rhodomonas_salina.1